MKTKAALDQEWITSNKTSCLALPDQIPVLLWVCNSTLAVVEVYGADLPRMKRSSSRPIEAGVHEFFISCIWERPVAEVHLRALQGESINSDFALRGRCYQATVKPFLDTNGAIAGCIGLAVDVSERKWSEEQMLHLALTDPLTGLANVRRLRDVFNTELSRSVRTRGQFAVLLFDLDGLKQLNDEYGHLIGTRALCRFADVLKQSCRSIDTAARYGGDEFILILPETDAQAAKIVANRVARYLSEDATLPRISASVGIAVCPGNGRTAEDLIAIADQELYRAKEKYTQSRQ